MMLLLPVLISLAGAIDNVVSLQQIASLFGSGIERRPDRPRYYFLDGGGLAWGIFVAFPAAVVLLIRWLVQRSQRGADSSMSITPH
jgi:hypothetical protein